MLPNSMGWPLNTGRVHTLASERSTMFAGPMNQFVLTDVEQQIELLRKQRIVVFKFQTEQWKGFDERAASDDHFRPALREQIQRGELLENAHRVGGTQHSDGTGEPDA